MLEKELESESKLLKISGSDMIWGRPLKSHFKTGFAKATTIDSIDWI